MLRVDYDDPIPVERVHRGIGWLPFYLESLEWQWHNSGAHIEHPEFELTPREYFLRQIYAPFQFETDSAIHAVQQLGDNNFMYETDFPHPTSMSPGPASLADVPKDFVEAVFSRLPEESQRKLVF